MEKGINLQIFELKEKLTKVINDSKLPITVTQMALFELSAQVNGVAMQEIEKERTAYKEGEQDGQSV